MMARFGIGDVSLTATIGDVGVGVGFAVMDDQGHARAAAWLLAFDGAMVTTRWVLAEAANSLAAPALRRAMAEFLLRLEGDPGVRIIGDSDGLYALRARPRIECGRICFNRRPARVKHPDYVAISPKGGRITVYADEEVGTMLSTLHIVAVEPLLRRSRAH